MNWWPFFAGWMILIGSVPFPGNLTQVSRSDNLLETGIDPLRLNSLYANYKYSGIPGRNYTQADWEYLVRSISTDPDFIIDTIGKSSEGLPIQSIQWGQGPVKVMMWARMHGDEPTAYMAMADLLVFLQNPGELDGEQELLNQGVTLKMIPCLNPDGARLFQRKNAQGIDINRDALELASPEARALMAVFNGFQPDWAFNLHDQSPYYTSGEDRKSVYFSFQVPPASKDLDPSPGMEKAASLIGMLIADLSLRLDHHHFARYPVRYSPEAFGEAFQQTGVPTILIESGMRWDDPDKQWLRKQHFILYLQMLYRLAQGDGHNPVPEYVSLYQELPECRIDYHDLVFEHLRIPFRNGFRDADVGFRRIWKSCTQDGTLRSLSYLGSIAEPYAMKGRRYINGKELEPELGREYPDTLADIEALINLPLDSLAGLGFTHFQMIRPPDSCRLDPAFPFAVNATTREQWSTGLPASFILKRRGGGASLLFHNGYLHTIDSLTSTYCQQFYQ